jgi:hypothetical protein
LGLIAVVNVLFFFILYRPVRSEYFRLQTSIEKARADVQSRRLKIDRLEKLSAQLETSAQDRQQLYATHFIPKETGWSAILSKLDSMVQGSVVKNIRKDYATAAAAQYGLVSVNIRLPVMALYPNIMKFINEIETADTFFIINSIDVRAAETAGTSDILMNLNIETFFYQ